MSRFNASNIVFDILIFLSLTVSLTLACMVHPPLLWIMGVTILLSCGGSVRLPNNWFEVTKFYGCLSGLFMIHACHYLHLLEIQVPDWCAVILLYLLAFNITIAIVYDLGKGPAYIFNSLAGLSLLVMLKHEYGTGVMCIGTREGVQVWITPEWILLYTTWNAALVYRSFSLSVQLMLLTALIATAILGDWSYWLHARTTSLLLNMFLRLGKVGYLYSPTKSCITRRTSQYVHGTPSFVVVAWGVVNMTLGINLLVLSLR